MVQVTKQRTKAKASSMQASSARSRLEELVEDLLILQGLNMGIPSEGIRTIVGVDKRRVNRISKVYRQLGRKE